MIAHRSVMRAAGLLSLATATVLGACSRNQLNEDPGAVPALIIFDNESLTQADLFAVVNGSGESRKLGTVISGRTEKLRLPYDLAMRGGVSLVARLLNGGLVSAGVVSIRPGDTVRVQLPLNRSMLMVLP